MASGDALSLIHILKNYRFIAVKYGYSEGKITTDSSGFEEGSNIAIDTPYLLTVPHMLTPVSYTHLDVYKRQVIALCLELNSAGRYMVAGIANGKARPFLRLGICSPVSYTHLFNQSMTPAKK